MYHAGPHWRTSTVPVAAETAANMTLTGGDDAAFSWFGTSVATFSEGGEQVVVVGAPGFHNSNGSVGRLYGFSVLSPSEAVPRFTVTGTEDKAKLGFALAATANRTLLTSLPSTGTALVSLRDHVAGGSIAELSIDALAVGDQLLPESALIWHGSGDFARLGWALAMVDGGQDGDLLAASAATADGERGQLELLRLGRRLPEARLQGAAKRERLGAVLLALDFDGDGRRNELAVASPRASLGTADNQQLVGSVQVLKL